MDRIDTHSLRSGGANALSLAGYTDLQIEKMGRWKGATLKEYIREELHVFSEGMSWNMKRKFQFVNISGGVFHGVTSAVLASEYTINAAAAKPGYSSWPIFHLQGLHLIMRETLVMTVWIHPIPCVLGAVHRR